MSIMLFSMLWACSGKCDVDSGHEHHETTTLPPMEGGEPEDTGTEPEDTGSEPEDTAEDSGGE